MWKNRFMIPWPCWAPEGEGAGGGGAPAGGNQGGGQDGNGGTPPAGNAANSDGQAQGGGGTPPAGQGGFPKVVVGGNQDGQGGQDGNQGATNEYFGAPEGGAYEDFNMPEGFSVDEGLVGKFAPIAAELGLSQAGAQKLADFYANEVVGPQSAAFVEQVSNWFDETQKDAEIGGQKFEASVDAATKALDAFGTDGLKSLLVQYGLGNHPEVVRFFARVGGAIAEDTSGGGGNNQGKEPDFLTLMYGPPNQ